MVTAIILATTKSGRERDVLEQLVTFKEIKEAHHVYGDYDMLIKAETHDMDTLNDFLTSRIRNLPDITMTTTMIGL